MSISFKISIFWSPAQKIQQKSPSDCECTFGVPDQKHNLYETIRTAVPHLTG